MYAITITCGPGGLDSISVTVKSFDYTIIAVFPDTIRARHAAIFKVIVNDSAKLKSAGGKFYWQFVIGSDTTDTSGTALSSVTRTVNDSAFMFVRAWVQDTLNHLSPSIQKSIIVRDYKPSLHFLKALDTTRVGISYTIKVKASDSDPAGGGVDSIFYNVNGSIAAKRGIDTTFTVTLTSAGLVTITGWAADNDGFLSNVDTLRVLVRSDSPYFNPPARDTTVYSNTSLLLKVNGTPGLSGVPIASYLWTITGVDKFKDTTAHDTLRHTFAKAGKDTVIVLCSDSGGLTSLTPDTFIVTIDLGKAIVSSINPDSVWIFDMTTFSVAAHAVRPGVHLDSVFVSWDQGPFVGSDTTHCKHAFTTVGKHYARIYVTDNAGMSSDTISDSVYVKPDKPIIDSVRVDSVIFVGDVRKYSIYAHDPHSAVDSFKVLWGNFSTEQGSGTFNHSFLNSESGNRAINVIAENHNGTWSDTLRDTLLVRLGKPLVAAITPDTSVTAIFINDARQFSISTYDTNGIVDSIKIDNGSGTFGPYVKTNSGSYVLNRTFTRAEAGSKAIRVIAKDNDGVLSDTSSLTVTVRLGAPVIDSLHVSDTIWINDTNSFQIAAHDTNGTIIRYYFDWTNSGTWQDSSANGKANGHFASAGLKTIRIGVLDNDTLLTTTTYQKQVHLGMPRVWNPQGDTMFVVTPAGGGNDTLKISHYDTNGMVQTFYWADNVIAGLDTSHVYLKGSADTLIYHITPPAVNVAFQMAIFGKDNDGIVAGDTFWLYPDAPPPAPLVSATFPANDSITIYWKGMDVHDGSLTQYEVLLHDGANPDTTRPQDIIAGWKNGYRASDIIAYQYMYRFKLTSSGGANAYNYQVLAKDARESVTESSVSSFPY